MDENDSLMLEDDKEMLPLPSSPYSDEVNVVGREEDKENIIKLVTAGENVDGSKLSVLPIVGMGGLGKTTLAQLVYNDRRVSNYFDIKGWVHVSPDSTVKNLASKILMSLTKRQFEATEMDDLQDELMEQVRGTKFFLVLDDVWNDNRDLWNPFLTPLLSAQMGMILLTTRNESVSRSFQTIPPYHLTFLPSDKSWILFRQLAFGSDNQNIDGDFESIGKKIMEKCGGLPLAIKAIASLLATDASIEPPPLESSLLSIDLVLEIATRSDPVTLLRCAAACKAIRRHVAALAPKAGRLRSGATPLMAGSSRPSSAALSTSLEEINALGVDFKIKPIEVIRRFLRLFKDPKYESIITYTLKGDLKSKTIKNVLGKITAFESYQLGLDDPQPSNLALRAEKQESMKSKKGKKKVVIEEEDDDDDDLTEDLALLMKKMKTFKNKFCSKSKGKCFNCGSKN
ncbi:hypothetical protein PR202_ga12553 [Eleusine coracana subsp. coracana]|uniref:NB-ARC domain-containing protein n=1 Tax=Eleusine coracana subsp. coracana TaxID=191504 RepID=A0AAV5CC85_ELECO|nr:hypothetical protein PR202_ga12553 [Eleusine coracana subsp. coracana]